MTASIVPGAALVCALRQRGLRVATAESLTGGLLASHLVDVAGSSAVMVGGVVAYQTEVKHRLLDVDDALLAEHGPVHPEVARQMATGARLRLGADLGVSTTGVAGPASQDGHPVGTVHVAVSGAAHQERPAWTVARRWQLSGTRTDMRVAAVLLAAALLSERLEMVQGTTSAHRPLT